MRDTQIEQTQDAEPVRRAGDGRIMPREGANLALHAVWMLIAAIAIAVQIGIFIRLGSIWDELGFITTKLHYIAGGT